MKATILKRLEALEKATGARNEASLIFITYDEEKGKYKARTDYSNNKRKEEYFDRLQDIVISPAYKGTVLIELFNSPIEIEQNLFSLQAEKIRKEAHIEKGAGFSICLTEQVTDITVNAEVIEWKE